MRGVERGVEQRDRALTEQVRQALTDDRAGGADHDGAREVHVVRAGADLHRDVGDTVPFGLFQVYADGIRDEFLVRIDASQTLAHSGCLRRQDHQFPRTEQALVRPRRIVHQYRAERTRRVIDQLREAVHLNGRVHIGHDPAPRSGPHGTKAQSHSIR
ncbi:hypothetical protein V1227_30075 [Lentzea sp. DG1S-22]|uniref:hypothetical protein n=1 Tax=Lentzea sp. DG1S-22 TaxID=3108822 RepID=UPI002E7A696F|nr:hypothetical protein [Lentzea sp. DG1S-22]WVH79256.1 hypothetical protein V1227_30075 [Lentzea sp. DG1S-22]